MPGRIASIAITDIAKQHPDPSLFRVWLTGNCRARNVGVVVVHRSDDIDANQVALSDLFVCGWRVWFRRSLAGSHDEHRELVAPTCRVQLGNSVAQVSLRITDRRLRHRSRGRRLGDCPDLADRGDLLRRLHQAQVLEVFIGSAEACVGQVRTEVVNVGGRQVARLDADPRAPPADVLEQVRRDVDRMLDELLVDVDLVGRRSSPHEARLELNRDVVRGTGDGHDDEGVPRTYDALRGWRHATCVGDVLGRADQQCFVTALGH